MARLALGVAGAVIGGYISGPTGARIGWAVGSAAGSYMDQPDGQDVIGPRLGDKSVQSSARGASMAWMTGTDRLAGNIIWSGGIQEHRHEEDNDGGKGGPDPGTTTTFAYTCSFAISFGKFEISGVRKVWADSVLIFDASTGASASSVLASSNTQFEVYLGTETQEPSPTIQAHEGVDNTPAYRGQPMLVFTGLELGPYGNRIPNITAELVGVGADTTEYSSIDELTGTVAYSQDVSYFDSSGAYLVRAFSTAYGNKKTIVKYFWPPGGTPVELDRFEHTYSQSVSVPLLHSISDEPGHFLLGEVVSAPVYYDINGNIEKSWLPFTGNPIVHFSATGVKVGEVYWFLYYDSYRSAAILRCGNIELISPETITPGTIGANIRRIRASADYLFAQCRDSVLGGIIVRYSAETLLPIDYIVQEWDSDQLMVHGASTIGYPNTNFFTMYIHDEFAATYTRTISLPDTRLKTGSYVSHWHFKMLENEAFICFKGEHNYSELVVGQSALSSNTIPLSTVVSDLCLECGLEASEIDVAELAGIGVRGYTRSRPMQGRAALQPLLTAYNVVARESDWKMKFSVLDGAVDMVINPDHLSAHEYGSEMPDELTTRRQQEQELPRRVSVLYKDPDNDYQQGVQHAQRIAS